MTVDPDILEIARLQHERDAYRAMVCDLLASATPNERDHPSMSRQWARARDLLKNGPRVAATDSEVSP